MKAVKKTSYHLPTGEFTKSANKYAKAWIDLSKPLCKVTGAKLHACDPSVQLCWEGRIIDLPVSFVVKLNELAKRAKEKPSKKKQDESKTLFFYS